MNRSTQRSTKILDFDLKFFCFLHRNGYLRDDLFSDDLKWKLDKYTKEFEKVYSYERVER